jgi:energy-coupling factor transporter ATP-binding protein EcfA2
VERARALAQAGARRLLGIAGAPGGGKSTLADALVEALGPDTARLVGMDGFHLAQSELERLGKADRKGAPDTFDAAGYTMVFASMLWPRVTSVVMYQAGCTRCPRGHFPDVDFEDLYRATYPRVLAYARSVATREDADDAIAETYAIAWRRQRSIPRGAELGWLIGVTRRVLANTRRSRRARGRAACAARSPAARVGTRSGRPDLRRRAAGGAARAVPVGS